MTKEYVLIVQGSIKSEGKFEKNSQRLLNSCNVMCPILNITLVKTFENWSFLKANTYLGNFLTDLNFLYHFGTRIT